MAAVAAVVGGGGGGGQGDGEPGGGGGAGPLAGPGQAGPGPQGPPAPAVLAVPPPLGDPVAFPGEVLCPYGSIAKWAAADLAGSGYKQACAGVGGALALPQVEHRLSRVLHALPERDLPPGVRGAAEPRASHGAPIQGGVGRGGYEAGGGVAHD